MILTTEVIATGGLALTLGVGMYVIALRNRNIYEKAAAELQAKIDARKEPEFACDPVLPSVRAEQLKPVKVRQQDSRSVNRETATRKESKPRPSGRQMDRFRDEDSLLNPSNPLSVAHPLHPANPINLNSSDSKPSRCEPDRSSMFESSSERSSSYCSGSSGSSSYSSGSCSDTSSSSCD